MTEKRRTPGIGGVGIHRELGDVDRALAYAADHLLAAGQQHGPARRRARHRTAVHLGQSPRQQPVRPVNGGHQAASGLCGHPARRRPASGTRPTRAPQRSPVVDRARGLLRRVRGRRRRPAGLPALPGRQAAPGRLQARHHPAPKSAPAQMRHLVKWLGGHPGGRADAADLPAHRRAVREGSDQKAARGPCSTPGARGEEAVAAAAQDEGPTRRRRLVHALTDRRLADLGRPRDCPDTTVPQDPGFGPPSSAAAAAQRVVGTTPRTSRRVGYGPPRKRLYHNNEPHHGKQHLDSLRARRG